MIVAIGLAGNEIGRPPALFDEIFRQARSDGFKITAHCDIGVPNTHEHITQVLGSLGGSGGADRCDHGLNIADRPELVDMARTRNMGLTLCPWGYAIYQSENDIFEPLRKLFDAGLKVTINSDDPPYMMGHYTLGNLMLVKCAGGFSDAELVQCQRNAIEVSWAPDPVKMKLTKGLNEFTKKYNIPSVSLA